MTQVSSKNEVLFGDTLFPIEGAVTFSNITVPANPVIFGDASKKGDTQAMSAQIQSANTGGARIYRANSRTDTDRFWRSTCETRQRNAITLPPRTVSMGKPGTITTEQVTLTFNHLNQQYFVFANKVYRWLDATQTWSSLDYTLPTNPTDWAAFNNKLYLAYGNGYVVIDELGLYTNVATAASLFVVWDARLWRLTQTSGVWTIYALPVGGAWGSAVGSLPSAVTPTQMLVYRNAQGEAIIYIVTNAGLWAYDATNLNFDETEIRYPAHAQRSRAAVFNDGKMYLSMANLGLLSVTSGSQFVGQPVGLDMEDGVEPDQQGKIMDIKAEYNWMYVLVDASEAVNVTQVDSGLGMPFEQNQWPTLSGSSTLWAFSGTQWHVLWESATGNSPATTLGISSAYSVQRVYWSALGQAFYQDVYSGTFNPRQIQTREYATGCSYTSPWFDMGVENQTKLFKTVMFRLANASAAESVAVYYGLDLDDTTWYPLGTFTTDGQHEIPLNTVYGKAGYYIRLRFDLQRGSTINLSPNVEFWAVEWMRLLPATFAYTFLVDLSKSHKGVTPIRLAEKLLEYSDQGTTTTLLPFSFTDQLTDEVATYFGIMSRLAGQFHTGKELRGQGQAQVSIIVPKPREEVPGG